MLCSNVLCCTENLMRTLVVTVVNELTQNALCVGCSPCSFDAGRVVHLLFGLALSLRVALFLMAYGTRRGRTGMKT